jgi:hypothetical protein
MGKSDGLLVDWKNGLWPFFGHYSVDRRQKAWFLPAATAEDGRMRKSDGLLVDWKNGLWPFFGHQLRCRPQKARLLRPT